MDYFTGLDEFRARLSVERDTEVLLNFFNLEHRLLDNLSHESYGSTEAIRSERNQILDQLNKLAKLALDISFNELCPVDRTDAAISTAPPLPSYYVERISVMECVRSMLHNKRVSNAPTAILGMSGIGKTMLATALAHDKEIQAIFPQGILWSQLGPNARSIEDIKPWLLAWGTNLGVELNPAFEVNTLTSILTNALSKRKCLLIVDDVWSYLPASSLLSLRGPKCGAILTTREEDLAIGLEAASLRLEVLLPSEAKLLIERRLSRETTKTELADIEELLARLGYLPLAISLAAAQAKLGMKWNEMLMALREVQTTFESLDFSRPEAQKQSLEISFNLTYERLNQEDQRRYRVLGTFAPEVPFLLTDVVPIWFDITKDSEGDKIEEAKRWTQVYKQTEKSLRDFAIRGILQRVGNQQTDIYQQHPLLRLDALRRLQPEERTLALETHAAWFKSIADHYIKAQQYSILERAGPQIYAILRRLRRGYSGDPGLAVFSRDQAKRTLIELVMKLTDVWIQKRRYTDIVEWVSEAVECCRSLGEQEAESANLGNLGTAYLGTGNFDRAVHLFRESREIDRQLGRRIGEVVNLHNLSSALAEQNDFRQAVELADEALKIAREIGNKWREAESLAILGGHQARLGNAQKGKEFLKQALEIAQAENRRSLIRNIQQNLGDVFLTLNDPESALAHLREAAIINQDFADPLIDAEITSMLGEALEKLGQYNEAVQHLEYALRVSEQLNDHKSMGRSLTGLARSYLNLSRTKQALQFCEQALELDRRMGWHRDELVDLKVLAAILEKRGRRRQVLETLEKALVVAKKLDDLKEQGSVLFWLAMARYSILEKTSAAQATEYAKRALAIHEQVGDIEATIEDLLFLGQINLISARSISARSNVVSLIYLWRALRRAEQIQDKQSQLKVYVELAKVYEVSDSPLLEWQILAQATIIAEEIGNLEAQRLLKSRFNALRRKLEGLNFDMPSFNSQGDGTISTTTAELAAWVVEGCKGNQELWQKAYDLASADQAKSTASDRRPIYTMYIGLQSDADQSYHDSLNLAFRCILDGLRNEDVLKGLSGRVREIASAVLEQLS